MTFSEKLKQAMQELHLNQRQVCGMTGKSKGSVSQYISGKQIPSDDVQSAIAAALGLESDYFSKAMKEKSNLFTKLMGLFKKSMLYRCYLRATNNVL